MLVPLLGQANAYIALLARCKPVLRCHNSVDLDGLTLIFLMATKVFLDIKKVFFWRIPREGFFGFLSFVNHKLLREAKTVYYAYVYVYFSTLENFHCNWENLYGEGRSIHIIFTMNTHCVVHIKQRDIQHDFFPHYSFLHLFVSLQWTRLLLKCFFVDLCATCFLRISSMVVLQHSRLREQSSWWTIL